MSPSGRFQSRVLSQLSQQTLRWKDRAARWWRQMQVTAVWSSQILLYPVYAVVQTGRLLGRQLGQTVQQVRPRLQAVRRALQTITQPDRAVPIRLKADTSIHKTLRTVEELGLVLSPATAEPATAEPATATLQGIASLLSSRSLVLVTAPNGILDILTPAQQARLQRQIIWELADYGRSALRADKPPHRQLAPQRLLLPPSPLPPLVAQDTMVLPVQVFYRLMGWVQRGPVAIAANVFDETTLALYFPSTADLESEAIAAIDQPWLAFPDLPDERELASAGQALADLVTDLSTNLATDLSTDLAADLSTDLAAETIQADRVPASTETSIALSPASMASLGVRSHQDDLEEIAIARHRIETYIETQSTLVSYEKHPLERVLAWLDQKMLWVEKKFVEAWNWLRGLPSD